MKMRSIILLSFCLSISMALDYKPFQNLRYPHAFLGQLKVSQQKFPLLTSVSNPETIFIVPNGPQMKEIDTILKKQQGKRRRRQAAPDLMADMKYTVKKFLLEQFGNEITVPPAPQSINDLPFTSFSSMSNFDFVWLPKINFLPFMGAFLTSMQSVFEGKTWFPISELAFHVYMCGTSPEMISYTAILEGVKFNTTMNGNMAYFQVSCMSKGDDLLLGISSYGMTFGLKTVAQEKQVTKEWNALFANAKKSSVSTHTLKVDAKWNWTGILRALLGKTGSFSNTFEKPMYDESTLTVAQMNLLVEYLRGFVLRNINQSFRDYFTLNYEG